MNVALYSALLCPAWEASPVGALGLLAPQELLPRDLCGLEGQKQGCWQGPADTGRPPGPQQGSRRTVWAAPAQCLWGGVKAAGPLPGLSTQAHCALKWESSFS